MKPFYRSWTVWFAVLQIVAALSGFTVHAMDKVTAYTLLTTGLATLGFRIKTDSPISL